MPDKIDNDEKSFLSRWSERKLEDKKLKGQDVQNKEHVNPEDIKAKELELEENRKAAEAINIEELTDKSDYQVFFKEGVSDAVKQMALRKLWRSNPVFANLDGLNDYDENFASPHHIIEKFQSAWKVGKGYLQRDSVSEEIKTSIVEDDKQKEVKEKEPEINELLDKDDQQIETTQQVIVEQDPDIPKEHIKTDRKPHLTLRHRMGVKS